MRRIASAAIAAIIMLGLLVLYSQADPATPIVSSKEREARQRKLEQMAVLVSELSVGKSRLMLKSAEAANPTSRALRDSKEFGNAFLKVYPVTTPVNARILVTAPDIAVVRQYGRILGAVEVITPIGGSEDKRRADAGVYLLFIPIDGPLSTELPIWLVSLTVGDDGKVTHAAAAQSTVKLTPSRLGDDEPSPVVTPSIDFTKATVSMTWKEQAYGFSFEMDIFYAMPDTLWFARPIPKTS